MNRKHLLIKILSAALMIMIIVSLAVAASGKGGSSDPLVTLSYLTDTYKSGVIGEVNTVINTRQKQLTADFSNQIEGLKKSLSAPEVQPAANDYVTEVLESGQSVEIGAGSEVLFLSGTAKTGSVGLTDTTAGTPVAAGGTLTANHLYVAVEACTITASDSVKLLHN